MAMQIIPPDKKDVTIELRKLFLKTEWELINEINRKRNKGYVDYAEVAALERVQKILQNMVDESFTYVPEMIEKIFYRTEKDWAGYANARALTATQTAVVQQLSNNLLGQLMEVSETAYKTIQDVYAIGSLKEGPYREVVLQEVLYKEAKGNSWSMAAKKVISELTNKGITGFRDKRGRKWTISEYGTMAVRTTARQAEVAAVLTKDDYDLYQIVKIGSTCPVCAPLEGRVYSKSGKNPEYPSLAKAYGKIDVNGSDDLSNTFLCIHPNCKHSIVKYTVVGKTEEQIKKDKEFSSFEKNPPTNDPRTKKQKEIYERIQRNRQKLLNDKRQYEKYKAVLGEDIPKNLADFREIKYNDEERYNLMKLDYRRRNKT